MKSKTPALDTFGIDLTSPIVQSQLRGAPANISPRPLFENRIFQSLSGKYGRGTLLFGPPGTGKSYLAYAIAKRIVEGNAPALFRSRRVVRLDLSGMFAGTKYRGQFEERLKAVIAEVKRSPALLVLDDPIFVDRDWDQNQDSRLLASAVAQGHLQVLLISDAPTLQELPNDLSPFRHVLQPLKVTSTTNAETSEIIQSTSHQLERDYLCAIQKGALDSAVELGGLYISHYGQPGASSRLLDEACTTMALSQSHCGLDELHATDVEIRNLESDIRRMPKTDKKKIVAVNGLLSRVRERRNRIVNRSLESNIKAGLILTTEHIAKAASDISGVSLVDIESRSSLVRHRGGAPALGVPDYERYQTESILRGTEVNIEEGLAFALIPHSADFQGIYDLGIKPAAEANGLKLLRAADIYEPGQILNQVWNALRKAEVIIADTSGRNANVIYELGLSYGLRRCPILLTQNPSELPFNLRVLRHIEYRDSAQGVSLLKKNLTVSIQEFLAQVRTP